MEIKSLNGRHTVFKIEAPKRNLRESQSREENQTSASKFNDLMNFDNAPKSTDNKLSLGERIKQVISKIFSKNSSDN